MRRILLTGRYAADLAQPPDDETALVEKLRAGELTAAELLAGYCGLLYHRLGTYAEVAKRTGFDPRTSRKYIESVWVDVSAGGPARPPSQVRTSACRPG